MLHVPILRHRAERAARPFPYIDTLFDYGGFLDGARDGLGQLPAHAAHEPIAVVGAGLAGLVTAYELLRAGARDVTILEASSRAGGRAFSRPFSSKHPEFLAELGAMRFPPSEFALFHYLDAFGVAHTPNFPDPGKVLTNIGYQGRTYVWRPDSKHPPALFARVSTGWNATPEGKGTTGDFASISTTMKMRSWNWVARIVVQGRPEPATTCSAFRFMSK